MTLGYTGWLEYTFSIQELLLFFWRGGDKLPSLNSIGCYGSLWSKKAWIQIIEMWPIVAGGHSIAIGYQARGISQVMCVYLLWLFPTKEVNDIIFWNLWSDWWHHHNTCIFPLQSADWRRLLVTSITFAPPPQGHQVVSYQQGPQSNI